MAKKIRKLGSMFKRETENQIKPSRELMMQREANMYPLQEQTIEAKKEAQAKSKVVVPASQITSVEEQKKKPLEDGKVTEPKSIETVSEAGMPEGTDEKKVLPRKRIEYKPYIYVPLIVDKDLTIIMVEHTDELAKYKTVIEKIITSFNQGSRMIGCILYGEEVLISNVTLSEKFFSQPLKELTFEKPASLGVRFFDAIEVMAKSITSIPKTYAIEEKEYRVNDIEIIGIGTGVDFKSKNSQFLASIYLDSVLNKSSSKYFCIKDEQMVNVASLGFRSIGFLDRKY